jgi:glycosyltransferase involved in cell wall biosynthesis
LRGVGGIAASTARGQFDAVLTTFHWPPRVSRTPMFGVIHDLRELRHQPNPAARRLQSMVAHTWGNVLVPSAHVGEDVRRLLGVSSVTVVGEGVDHIDRFLPSTVSERPFITVIAGRAAHKRAALGIAAARQARGIVGGRIAIIGPSARPERDELHLSEPDDKELGPIYAATRVLIAPSSYEGFGLAVGEAMRAGALVVHATDGTLLPLVAVGGIAAAPEPGAMAIAVQSLWTVHDGAARARRAVERFTWAATAENVLDAMGVW